jgi:hypothetical protein
MIRLLLPLFFIFTLSCSQPGTSLTYENASTELAKVGYKITEAEESSFHQSVNTNKSKTRCFDAKRADSLVTYCLHVFSNDYDVIDAASRLELNFWPLLRKQKAFIKGQTLVAIYSQSEGTKELDEVYQKLNVLK